MMIFAQICYGLTMRKKLTLLLFCFTILLSSCADHQTRPPLPETQSSSCPPLQRKGENSCWYSLTDSDTAFIFVHGIFSDSRDCWLYEDGVSQIYWPELIRTDPNFDRVSIYLAGFYTSIQSNDYGVASMSKDVYAALKRSSVDKPSVMSKKNLVFIGHSTGGIVIRRILENNYEDFKNKTVGVVLMASPSGGAAIASYLSSLTTLYENKLGKELQWQSPQLQDLDDRFRDLIYKKKIPRLVGKEAYENNFILHSSLFPIFNKTRVVPRESLGKYFDSPALLPNTDHFSIVKPDNRNHPGYLLLYDFYKNDFSALVTEASQEEERALKVLSDREDLKTFLLLLDAKHHKNIEDIREKSKKVGMGTDKYEEINKTLSDLHEKVKYLYKNSKLTDAFTLEEEYKEKLASFLSSTPLILVHESLKNSTVLGKVPDQGDLEQAREKIQESSINQYPGLIAEKFLLEGNPIKAVELTK